MPDSLLKFVMTYASNKLDYAIADIERAFRNDPWWAQIDKQDLGRRSIPLSLVPFILNLAKLGLEEVQPQQPLTQEDQILLYNQGLTPEIPGIGDIMAINFGPYAYQSSDAIKVALLNTFRNPHRRVGAIDDEETLIGQLVIIMTEIITASMKSCCFYNVRDRAAKCSAICDSTKSLAYNIRTVLLCAYGLGDDTFLAKALRNATEKVWIFMPNKIAQLPESIFKEYLLQAGDPKYKNPKGREPAPILVNSIFNTAKKIGLDLIGFDEFAYPRRTISKKQALEFLDAAGLAPEGHGVQCMLTGLL